MLVGALSVVVTCAAGVSPLAAAPKDQAEAPPARSSQAVRPNLVIFLADDLGYKDTGAYSNRDVRTPNLDRLTAQSIAFDRAFVASPACAPSRAALLTGLMPARNGAEPNQVAPHSWIRKLPSYLQAAGYEVVAFGKVAHYRQTGQYGFDHYAHDTFHDPDGVAAAIDWLKKRRDPRPLALFVGSNWPHVPWPKTTEGYEPGKIGLPGKSVDTPTTRDARARYYAAVTRMDTELGQVLDASDRVLGPQTMVLFTSDHGAQWPFGKWNLYDTGTRVPLVVRWAGQAKPGTRSNAMVSWVDILPTLIDVAGGTPPEDIDGRSFAPVLRGTSTTARTEIFTTHTNDGKVNVYPMRSVRTDRWKYIRNQHPEWVYTTHIDQFVDRVDSGTYFPSWREARKADPAARHIVDSYYRRPAEELYDLVVDPDETRNLAKDPRHAATLGQLRARLDAWQREQGDTMRLDAPPHLTEERTIVK
jgi:uncharacterized sulfatase